LGGEPNGYAPDGATEDDTMIASRMLRGAAAVAALLLLTAGRTPARAQAAKPFISPMFTDNMVLQRGMPTPVWGWAAPGQKVTVSMEGRSATATADGTGKWMARIGPFTAGGPFTLTVSGPQSAALKNVLVGDVWVCSGQSNMEMGIGNVNNAAQEISTADYPQIRLFTVQKTIALEPQSTLSGQWDVCTPKTVASGGWGGFSAVGYFFGRELYKDLKVPIGLIHTSWGGTVAEAWTSAEALETMPDFKPAVAQVVSMRSAAPGKFDMDRAMAEWWSKNDPGSRAGETWYATTLSDSDWKTMSLPTLWEDAGLKDFDGLVWFRREVDVPAEAAGKEATLNLGPIDDRDTTWVNGTKVGENTLYNANRVYKIPAGVLKAGRNIIAVRVLDTGGGGGVYGSADQLHLDAGGSSIPLHGDWRYKVASPLSKMTPVPVDTNNNPNISTVLYNGMIAPVLPYGIKGAIWYQGESNAGRAYQYRTLLPTMIRDWRNRFESGQFPFFIVQLANFMQTDMEPRDDAWPELREAQDMTARSVGKSAIATAIDIGDTIDIHPKNKQEVGRRLALDALAIAYGKKVEYSGPTYKSMKRDGNRMVVAFDHLGAGLTAKGGKLTGFAVAGRDHKFVWADAVIEGNSVAVWSPGITDPVAVRYAWSNNPVANLYNKANLPALPFRTDQWPGVTASAK
jgi:sialate O-acetylesterase